MPPEGLLSRIMRRLGLERELRIVKRHLGLFLGLAMGVVVLIIFAVIGMREVLSESSFGQYLSLAFSDPGAVLRNWHSFALSIGESIPGAAILLFLIPLTFLLVLLRLVGIKAEKFLKLTQSIHTK